MTDDNTQSNRDIELDLYRGQLTLIANGEIGHLLTEEQSGVLRVAPNDFAQGFEYGIEIVAEWADRLLQAAESLHEGVDITPEERKFAEEMVAQYHRFEGQQ